MKRSHTTDQPQEVRDGMGNDYGVADSHWNVGLGLCATREIVPNLREYSD